jgi:hypothetical protein
LGKAEQTGEGKMEKVLAVLFLSVLPISCADLQTAETRGTVRDSARVYLIDLPAESETDPVLALAIDPAWAPGAGLEIERLSDVAITPDERVLLLDGLGAQVHVRSPSGETWVSFGGVGERPGEFSSRGLLGNLVLTDSSVLVPDLDLQRITEFSFRGEVLQVRPYPLMAYAVDWRSHPDGGLIFRALNEKGDDLIRWVGDQVDTLYSFPIIVDTPNLLLQPWALWDFTTDGRLVSGRSDQGNVELRIVGAQRPDWATQWSIIESIVGEDEKAHLTDLAVESVRVNQPGCTDETVEAVLAATTFPESAPILAGILAAPNGDIWVRQAKPVLSMGLEALRIGSAEGFGGERWDILNGEGLLRAQLQLPKGFSPRQFSGPWLYGIQANPRGTAASARVRIDSL